MATGLKKKKNFFFQMKSRLEQINGMNMLYERQATPLNGNQVPFFKLLFALLCGTLYFSNENGHQMSTRR